MTQAPMQQDPTSEDAGMTAEAAAAESAETTIERLHAEMEQVRADMLRERADLENQRKRMAREVENARKFANERLLGDLLPLFDSLEAGLATAPEGDPVRAGMELTLRQLERIAQANGLVAVSPAAGDGFNPEHHQAMSLVDAPGVAPGAVAQTCQKGYLLNERLLRPALVMVAKQD